MITRTSSGLPATRSATTTVIRNSWTTVRTWVTVTAGSSAHSALTAAHTTNPQPANGMARSSRWPKRRRAYPAKNTIPTSRVTVAASPMTRIDSIGMRTT